MDRWMDGVDGLDGVDGGGWDGWDGWDGWVGAWMGGCLQLPKRKSYLQLAGLHGQGLAGYAQAFVMPRAQEARMLEEVWQNDITCF